MPALLLVCFVISGGSSLVLEVVWSRELTQVFGSTTLAISTVLATFMGGLALGSWLGGRLADRLRRDPLIVYALCELGIAICAVAIPMALTGYPEANAWLWRSLATSPWLLAVARFALCAVVLLPPTTLMGATLPLLARRVIRTQAELGLLGQRVGALYAANTCGAVIGAAGAGFLLIPTVGVRATNLLAASAGFLLAVAIAAALLIVRRRTPTSHLIDPVEPALVAALGGDAVENSAMIATTVAPTVALPVRARRALWAFAVSGAVAMTLEVLWSRALALVLGSSIYSFTLVLVVFLLGLGAGATWIGRPAARSSNPLGILAIVFLGAGASVVLTHVILDHLPAAFLALLRHTDFSVGTILFLQAILAGLTVLPTAACLGAVMPLAVRAYAGDTDAVGRDVGRAYAANTAGAIIGSFAGGFLVLPLLGLERGVRACALADLALAALCAWRNPSRRTRRATWIVAPALALWSVISPGWNLAALTSGMFRITLAARAVKAGKLTTQKVLYYRDGVSTTVTVEDYGVDRVALKNNGKVEASTYGDMPTQILVGLMPVLLHAGADEHVAVVGYGSGITVGAIAQAPEVTRVDVVELEPAVLEAADRWFSPYNHRPQDDPKVHRWLGDGRNFLSSRPETYDVIVSEPSNPWIAGVASLFTREFYAFAKRHLAPGGVFCQWAQLYELGPRNVKTIYRTFHEAFPYVYAFISEDVSADTILVGSLTPLPLDVARLLERAAEPTTAAELTRARIGDPLDLVALLILGPDEVASFAAGGQINTDDNAIIEFAAPRDLLAAGKVGRFADAIFLPGWPYGHLAGLLSSLGDGTARGDLEARLARRLIGYGRQRESQEWYARAQSDGAHPEEIAASGRLLRLVAERDETDPEVALTAGGAGAITAPTIDWLRDTTPAAVRGAAVGDIARAIDDVAAGRFREAEQRIERLPPMSDTAGGKDLRFLWGYVLYQNAHYKEAVAALQELCASPDFVTRRPAALYYLGRSQYGDMKFRLATKSLEEFGRRWPELVPGR